MNNLSTQEIADRLLKLKFKNNEAFTPLKELLNVASNRVAIFGHPERVKQLNDYYGEADAWENREKSNEVLFDKIKLYTLESLALIETK